MALVSSMEYQPDLEQHLERWALDKCLPATFIQCLISNAITPAIQFTTAKGKSVTIQGSDIADTRTWKKFLKSLVHEGAAYSLSKDSAALAELYQQWLLRDHTVRYQEITSQAHHEWLKRVTMLAVVRFLTWHKYERYAAGEKEAIVDAWVANQLHQLWLVRQTTKDLARLVHHIMDDSEHERQLIEQFCATLDEQVKNHTLTVPDSLPRLQEGMSHPFLLLPEHREGHDE